MFGIKTLFFVKIYNLKQVVLSTFYSAVLEDFATNKLISFISLSVK